MGMQKYKRRLEEQGKGTAQNMDLESKPEMMELTRQIEEKVKKAEEEGKNSQTTTTVAPNSTEESVFVNYRRRRECRRK